jgi:hypothetical protein
MKSVIAILLLLCHSLLAGTPAEALNAFQQAAKDQNFEDTWKHTAQFEGASKEVTQFLKSRIERILELPPKGWRLEVLEEKINGDCAVILANEIKKAGQTELNLDAVFLVKQGSEWKVMPCVTRWDLSKHIAVEKQPDSMKLDQTKVAAYRELEKWVVERKAALRKARKEEGANKEVEGQQRSAPQPSPNPNQQTPTPGRN